MDIRDLAAVVTISVALTVMTIGVAWIAWGLN